MTVPAIPNGYEAVIPYLYVRNASQAMDFYSQAFGAKEVMRFNMGGGMIGHAEMQIGDRMFMLADEMLEMDVKSPLACQGTPVSVMLYVEDVDAFTKKAVAAGLEVLRPVQDQFFGDRSGRFKDPYGHIWNIATHIEDVSPAEMHKRAQALYG